MKEHAIKVPVDVSIDVFKVIVKENIKHEVAQVDENRALLLVVISLDKNSERHQDVLENIQNIVLDYQEYRFGENEEMNWRDL